MKKWIFAVALCGALGCSQQQEPGQPLQFAPAPPPPAAAPGAAEEEAAPSEAEPKSESREAIQADDAPTDAVDAPAAKAEENLQDGADLDQPMKRAKSAPKAPSASKGASDAATICDSACQKTCANAADKNVCAQAYAAGCFSGTAPATFDCGTSGEKRKIKADGVEERGMPVITP